jgi:hypothetical protein
MRPTVRSPKPSEECRLNGFIVMWKDYLNKGKGFLDKSKCLLGFHQGTWEYRQSTDCTQFMRCERCAVESERVEHRWGEWDYKAEGTCDLVRTCGRCSQTESQLKHVWGEPRHKGADTCDQLVVCDRCGDQEDRAAKHHFDRWTYRNQDDCAQVETCSRCGQLGQATRLQHDWEGWTQSAFYESRVCVCRHCGEMLVDMGGASTSMQAVERAIDRVAATKSWEEIRRHLHADRDTLLSPVAEKYLQFAVEQYPKDGPASEALAGARRIVTRCREIGIDQAIENLGGGAITQAAPASGAQPARMPNAGAAPAAAGRLDSRLIGHWRSTEIMPSGGSSFTMVTDTHCFLDAAGEFAFWSVRRSSFSDSNSARQLGTWEARDGELHLRFQTGAPWSKAYNVAGDDMLWPRDGRYRLWKRIG